MNQQFAGQKAPVEKQISGPVARVRVAVKGSSRTSDEPRPNDTLALMWQAFCALEGSPMGLEVIDQRTRCIRAPLLKRFCQFLDNNRIQLDHADCVERLLQREAPHMDWKPVIPDMLHLPQQKHKSKITHSPPTKKRPAPSQQTSHTIGGANGTGTRHVQPNRNQSEAKDTGYHREYPISIDVQEPKGTLKHKIHQEEISPKTSTKHVLDENEAASMKDDSSAATVKGSFAHAKDRSFVPDPLEAQQSSTHKGGMGVDHSNRQHRKGGMRVDPTHINLLNIKKKPETLVATQNPPEYFGTPPVPTESQLRGNDQHAWPLLNKDLQFIFQPKLWPAFCKKETFRMPRCYLPGYGFGLIDSQSNTIRIALVLKFFRFLKKDNDQATMARCVRILNKVILTESLSLGLDWEVISLEKVKPILKIIGVKTLDDALPQLPETFDLQAILALNRDLTQSIPVPPNNLPMRNIPVGSEAELQLLQLRQQMSARSGEPVGSPKVDDLLRRVFQREENEIRTESKVPKNREQDDRTESRASKSSDHDERVESKMPKSREHGNRAESRASNRSDPDSRAESRASKGSDLDIRAESRSSRSGEDSEANKGFAIASKIDGSLPKHNQKLAGDTHHAELKAKCSNIVESVEDLINSMEAAQNRSPSYSGTEDAEAQAQYQMVADSLNKLTEKAALLLESRAGESGSGSDPMENTLMMLKSSVETLSSKLDAVSQSLRSRNDVNDSSRSTAPTPMVASSSPTSFICQSPWDFAHRNNTPDDQSDSELNDDDIEMARKRAILCHAAAERDRLKKQRTD